MPEVADASQQSCPACGATVNVAEAEPLARVPCPACGEKFRVERAFDNFVVVETLGVGGMGSVYKARDTRLERFVALKLLRKELSADPAEAARLEQEARVTASVNHPNVVQVYSSGTAHGQIYLVMELVDHGSLDDLMAQHARVPERQVLEAGIQVAKGLQAAQERGLIHRDVKPANILFSNAQTAKIGDFGLAGAAEQKSEARNEIWGTPYYVAPERLDNLPEDFRSDIYSLGATLFHALAGRPPMEGETTSAAELRRLKSHPPNLQSVAPDISRETARAIDKMLAPNPANRFTSYAHLIDQLQRALGALQPGGRNTNARKWWMAASGAALVAALAVGAFVFQKRNVPQAAPAPSASVTPDNTAALQQRYEEARRQLIGGNYDAAAKTFPSVISEAQNRQPLSHWARLHVGLASLLQGKVPPARDAFQQIERAGAFSTSKGDADLAHFFTETSKALAAPGPIRGGAELTAKGVDAFALFLFGLKDWQLREFDEGAGLLRRFVESEPPNEFKWIADYKPLARKHLADHALYAEWKAAPRPEKSSDVRAMLEKLRALTKRVQSRGAIADYFKAEEKSLSATVADLEKSERATQERAEAEDFERRKPALLAQWKGTLIKDLSSGAYKAPITMGVTTHAGVLTANEREITLRIAPYGGAPVLWDKFPPAALLKMSQAFIKPSAADAADRHWLAAVYAQSTGQSEAARPLADEAAKAKPEYRDQLRLLFPAER